MNVDDVLNFCQNYFGQDWDDTGHKNEVFNECAEAEAWLREKKQQLDSLSKHSTPVLLSADVKRKAEALDRFCRPIMTKPKPKLAKPATPEVSSPSGDQSQGSENFDSATYSDAIAKVGLYKFLSDLFWIGMFYHLYNQNHINTREIVEYTSNTKQHKAKSKSQPIARVIMDI
ncbi:hypothetical protein POM88_022862 [Heracleum sosnowskyi]|uniref:Uncharacterized protein n=1 Tax=Heracleum sosnowskyi TaxID=360622 RepID=A0AAD8MUA3_9APIA|nr:hypothetical protein POM88_022862 [Heracleum sosnowskyi]